MAGRMGLISSWESKLKTDEEKELFNLLLEEAQKFYQPTNLKELKEKVAEAVWRTFHDPYSVSNYLNKLGRTVSDSEKKELHKMFAVFWFVNGYSKTKTLIDNLMTKVIQSEDPLSTFKDEVKKMDGIYIESTLKLVDKLTVPVVRITSLPRQISLKLKTKPYSEEVKKPEKSSPVQKVQVPEKGVYHVEIPEELAEETEKELEENERIENEAEKYIRVHIHPGGIRKEFEFPETSETSPKKESSIFPPYVIDSFSQWAVENITFFPKELLEKLPEMINNGTIEIGYSNGEIIFLNTQTKEKYVINKNTLNDVKQALGIWAYLYSKEVDNEKLNPLLTYLKDIELPENDLGYQNFLELFTGILDDEAHFKSEVSLGERPKLLIVKGDKKMEFYISDEDLAAYIETKKLPEGLAKQYRLLKALNGLLDVSGKKKSMPIQEKIALTSYLAKLEITIQKNVEGE